MLLTIYIALNWLGISLLYIASKKTMPFHQGWYTLWGKEHQMEARISGAVVLAVSLFVSIFLFGVGTGIFVFSIGFMTIASLIVLLAPLPVYNYKLLILSFLLIGLTELLLS